MIKAVIFDMDGLMIDSEPLHYRAFTKALSPYHIRLDLSQYVARYVALPDKECTKDMVKRFAIPISSEKLYEEKRRIFQLLLPDVKVRHGLFSLLENLEHGHFRMAIASSSLRSEINAVVHGLNIAKYFNVLCSSEDILNGKPAPDIYLFAADALKMPPEACLVLEDAPKGVAAARAANMLCIAIPNNETKDSDFRRATTVLPDLTQVSAWIQSYNRTH